jgi:hypothetical protein
LEKSAAAEVLLRAGSLTSCIGNQHQVTGAQETAKNLISQSLSIFESTGDKKNVAEA